MCVVVRYLFKITGLGVVEIITVGCVGDVKGVTGTGSGTGAGLGGGTCAGATGLRGGGGCCATVSGITLLPVDEKQ